MALLVTGGYGVLGDGSLTTLVVTSGYGQPGSAISVFHLQDVTQSIVRLTIKFDSTPKAVNSTNVDDALNPSNYTLTGPGPSSVTVTLVAPVPSDLTSFTLTLSGALSRGAWTLGAANIKNISNVDIDVPSEVTFVVSSVANDNVINPGSTNDTSEDIIRKHLNPALKGEGWDALISSLSTGDDTTNANTVAAFNQLYKATATGAYLDRLTSNDGVSRPRNVGVGDDIYRKLAIAMANNKVVDQAVLAVLQVFYGEDAVRAAVYTENSEPFVLYDGDELNVTLDGKTNVTVTFNTSEFELIGAADAEEVASAITRAFVKENLTAFAVSFIDPADGLKRVKLYSGALGLKGSVQIGSGGGGKAQNGLAFTTSLNSTVYTGIV